jgi:uncharacterized protein YjgD (DUF1641 family)
MTTNKINTEQLDQIQFHVEAVQSLLAGNRQLDPKSLPGFEKIPANGFNKECNGIEFDFQQQQTIERFLSTLASLFELWDDLQPINQSIFNDLILKLDEFQSKGYFEFLKELFRIFDNIVTHFSVDEVRQLSENVVSILETVKNMTQPDVLHSMNNAIQVYRHLDVDKIEEYSIFKVIRELNKPEMKRGIGFVVSFLQNISGNHRNETKQETQK